MSRYTESNASEREADRLADELRADRRHEAAEARADEDSERLSLEDGSYDAYWLNRVYP